MLKRKICSLLASLMITTTVLGTNVQAVGATVVDAIASPSIDNSESDNENQENILADGTYKISNKALKSGTDSDSAIRNYIDTDSIVTIKGGKITVTMKYNEAGLQTVKTTNSITVDGQEVEFVKNEDGSISFDIESTDLLYTRINVNLTYYNENLPEEVFPGKLHKVDVDLLHEGELIKDSSNDSGSNDENQGNVLANGIYKITNKTLKTGTDNDSAIRNYIDTDSIVTVKDGKITVTMKYNKVGLETVKTTNSITVDGQEVEFVKNEDGSISFGIESTDLLYTRINVNLTYYNENLPEEVFPGKLHKVDIDLLHEGELTEYKGDNSSDNSGSNGEEETPINPDNNGGNTGNDNSNNGSSNNGTIENAGTKVYTGKLEVIHENSTGLNMAKQAIEDTLKVEDVNGKKYVTLTFTNMGSTMMSNHEIYVNGNKVDTTKTVNGNIVSLRFAVGSLQDSIKVSAHVSMMGSNVEFGVNVLEDTLKLVADGTTGGTIGGTTGGTTGSTTEGTTSGSSNNGSVSNGSTSNTEQEITVVKGKLYSIQNSVSHESETGRNMARKYLSSTSKVEEIEGTYYVTLTFTGAEFMQNHEIYVNGSKVSASKSTNGDETYVRFAVSSLNDSIKVKTYVVPMAREVEFGVELLEDTLTFIKEYTVEKLPNTGAAAGAGSVAGLGLLMTSAGAVLLKKRR